jgi:hypothetical protein
MLCLLPLFLFATFYCDAVRMQYYIWVSDSCMHFISSLMGSQCICVSYF